MTVGEIAAALICVACVVLCFAAAILADRRYVRFEKLPGLFGITGEVLRLDPRRFTLYLYPVLAGGILALALVLPVAFGLPTHGNLVGVFVGLGLAFVCSMALHLWMIERWARGQG